MAAIGLFFSAKWRTIAKTRSSRREVLRRPAAGYYQSVIVLESNIRERRVKCKTVAGFLGVSLVAFEVVDGGFDHLAGSFAGADRVDRVPDHLQSLKRHHDLEVLDEVADEQQYPLRRHEHLHLPLPGVGGPLRSEPTGHFERRHHGGSLPRTSTFNSRAMARWRASFSVKGESVGTGFPAGESADFLAVRGIPYAQSTVKAAADETLAAVAECESGHSAMWPSSVSQRVPVAKSQISTRPLRSPAARRFFRSSMPVRGSPHRASCSTLTP